MNTLSVMNQMKLTIIVIKRNYENSLGICLFKQSCRIKKWQAIDFLKCLSSQLTGSGYVYIKESL